MLGVRPLLGVGLLVTGSASRSLRTVGRLVEARCASKPFADRSLSAGLRRDVAASQVWTLAVASSR